MSQGGDMSSTDFVIEETYHFDIKEEQIQFGGDQIRSESPPKQTTFEEDSSKCGVVMVARGGGFTIVCSLCLKHFNNLKTFRSHIRNLHWKTESNGVVKNEIVENGLIGKIPKPLDNELFAIEVSDDLDQPCSDSLEGNVDESKKDCGQSDPSNDKTALDRSTEIEISVENQDIIMQKLANNILRTCKYCDQQFFSFATFKEHVLSHKGPYRYVCSYCPKTFPEASVRNAHLNTHTGERPHKCPHCSKAFACKTNLNTHIRSHLKIRKYSCSYCDRRFVQSGDKKIHERTHTGEKPYQCEECGKRFTCRARLTDHIGIHSNVKNYKCEVCGKAFVSSRRLWQHMPAHSDARPYHCNICGRNFPRKKALRAHEQLHSDVKKYVCDICGKAFAQNAGLYSHKKSHGEKP